MVLSLQRWSCCLSTPTREVVPSTTVFRTVAKWVVVVFQNRPKLMFACFSDHGTDTDRSLRFCLNNAESRPVPCYFIKAFTSKSWNLDEASKCGDPTRQATQVNPCTTRMMIICEHKLLGQVTLHSANKSPCAGLRSLPAAVTARGEGREAICTAR